MPTNKPRYMFTDTGELSEMLDVAQQRWPELTDRKDLLLRLALLGQKAIEEAGADRRRAVEETAGILSGVFKPGDLKRLREDWPQ